MVRYRDYSAFRQVFKEVIGLPPAEYRSRFGLCRERVAGRRNKRRQRIIATGSLGVFRVVVGNPSGCPVLRRAGTTSREATLRNGGLDQTDCALSRARPEILCFSVDKNLHGCQSSGHNLKRSQTPYVSAPRCMHSDFGSWLGCRSRKCRAGSCLARRRARLYEARASAILPSRP
jgi:hypothetical protein